MGDSDRKAFHAEIDKLCAIYGTWAVLHEFTQAMRPLLQTQIDSEKPPKQPRKNSNQGTQ